ncbi:MAG: Hpt domain-containing protein [Gemmataceae bacterium]
MSESEVSLLDLFREEVTAHTGTLVAGLVELEAEPTNPGRIEPLMRAAHSIKGAARILGLDAPVRLAHVMEDALVAAQHGRIVLGPADVDVLLRGTDLLAELARLDEAGMAAWGTAHAAALPPLITALEALARGQRTAAAPPPPPAAPTPAPVAPAPPIRASRSSRGKKTPCTICLGKNCGRTRCGWRRGSSGWRTAGRRGRSSRWCRRRRRSGRRRGSLASTRRPTWPGAWRRCWRRCTRGSRSPPAGSPPSATAWSCSPG